MIYILKGLPGVGKTSYAENWAKENNEKLIFHQCHAWTDADELFSGVNVQAAVAGDSQNVKQEGVLAITAKVSQKQKTCLVLDELDKTSEQAEYLLLDFLQSGRVPVAPGQHIHASMDNLTVFITTNGEREFSDALMRRGRRIFMQPLPVEQQMEVILYRSKTNNKGLVKILWKAARWVAEQEQNPHLSMQEGWNMVNELINSDKTKDAVISALQGWAARTEEGAINVHKCPHIPSIIGELKKE